MTATIEDYSQQKAKKKSIKQLANHTLNNCRNKTVFSLRASRAGSIMPENIAPNNPGEKYIRFKSQLTKKVCNDQLSRNTQVNSQAGSSSSGNDNLQGAQGASKQQQQKQQKKQFRKYLTNEIEEVTQVTLKEPTLQKVASQQSLTMRDIANKDKLRLRSNFVKSITNRFGAGEVKINLKNAGMLNSKVEPIVAQHPVGPTTRHGKNTRENSFANQQNDILEQSEEDQEEESIIVVNRKQSVASKHPLAQSNNGTEFSCYGVGTANSIISAQGQSRQNPSFVPGNQIQTVGSLNSQQHRLTNCKVHNNRDPNQINLPLAVSSHINQGNQSNKVSQMGFSIKTAKTTKMSYMKQGGGDQCNLPLQFPRNPPSKQPLSGRRNFQKQCATNTDYSNTSEKENKKFQMNRSQSPFGVYRQILGQKQQNLDSSIRGYEKNYTQQQAYQGASTDMTLTPLPLTQITNQLTQGGNQTINQTSFNQTLMTSVNYHPSSVAGHKVSLSNAAKAMLQHISATNLHKELNTDGKNRMPQLR